MKPAIASKIRQITALFALCLATHLVYADTPDRPNILIIFADDLGYETVGAYGGLDYETPQIDKMASEGLLFSRAYTSPVCTPSRVSLHTSLYTIDHKQTGVLPVHVGTKDFVNFEKMPTFAQLLQKAGYRTAVTGKWQLATLDFHPDHPYRSGFDSWCVWQIWDAKNNAKTTRYHHPSLNRDGYLLYGQTIEAGTVLPNGDVISEDMTVFNATDKFGPDVLNAYVKEKMAEATQAKEPFFILHNMMLPHSPIVKTPEGGPASLEGMIRYMDSLVGSLLSEIETLGIRDNTYVFFIGDNGTDTGKTRHTRAGTVDGGKRDLTDSGTHIPFIVWGPKSIQEGAVDDTLVDITDVFPTVCALANVSIPESIHIRGYNISPQINGKTPTTQQREWVHMGINGANALYDGHWRYIQNGNHEKLLDASDLPNEMLVTEDTEESKAARERLAAVLESLKSPHQ